MKEPEWSEPTDQIVSLRTSRASESFHVHRSPDDIREYIRNAADASDADAATIGSDRSGTVGVKINRQGRSILITDDGWGLSEREFRKRLTSIRGSLKRGTNARVLEAVDDWQGWLTAKNLSFALVLQARTRFMNCVGIPAKLELFFARQTPTST